MATSIITGGYGNYKARIWYYDVFKKRKSKAKQGFVKHKEAEAWVKKQLEIFEGGYAPKDASFSAIADEWYKLKEKLHLSPATLDYYKRYKNHFKGVFGLMPITEISERVLQNYISNNNETMYVFEQQIKVLSGIFSYCLKRRIIKENPLLFVDFPIGYKEHAPKDRNIYTETELTTLLKNLYADNSKLINPVILAVYFGLRRAEVCALKWDDINVSEKKLKINKAYVLNSEKTTKTLRSTRDFEISEDGYNLLKDFHLRNKIESEFICCNYDGSRQKPDNLSHTFKSYIDRKDKDDKLIFKKITFHDLRSIFGNLLRNDGSEIDTVSRAMGHSSTKVTEKHYLTKNKDVVNNALSNLHKKIKFRIAK